jgi:hypothetical protein
MFFSPGKENDTFARNLDQPSLRDWTLLFSFFQALRARLPSF